MSQAGCEQPLPLASPSVPGALIWVGLAFALLFQPLQPQPGSLMENLHGVQGKLKHFAALPLWQACQNSSRSVPVNRQKY